MIYLPWCRSPSSPCGHVSLWSRLPVVTSPRLVPAVVSWSHLYVVCLPAHHMLARRCIACACSRPWYMHTVSMSPRIHMAGLRQQSVFVLLPRTTSLGGLVHRIKRRWRQPQRQRLPLFCRIDSFIHLSYCICRGRVRGRYGSHSSRKSSCSH